jgi:predicted dehydrogenase
MARRTNRRQFLQNTGLAGVGFWVAGGATLGQQPRSPLEKLNVAGIGVGGKGHSDIEQAGKLANVVALCDIDDNTLQSRGKDYPKAAKFYDFREMLTKMGDKIDAVTVSTADHTHAPAAAMAMRLGKHVYCQKPLTHTVKEARVLRELARDKKVCTQMGNQGSAENGLREAVEIVQAGAIGPVREAHVWTNRPIWPQGTEAIFKVPGAREAALAALHGGLLSKLPDSAPPRHVHWDEWLGPAPERPYAPVYHPFAWRGWWDFGTGALGDMACHTANMAFRALKLGYPLSVQADSGEINPETFPTWATITFQFPARGDMPPVKFVWYEGVKDQKKNLPNERLLQGQTPPGSGSLLVGDKGTLYSPNDYGASFLLLPKGNFDGFQRPAPTLPRNGKGDFGMKEEWIRAIVANKPEIAYSNFDYAGLLTETILLGNAAMRAGKKKLEWDGEKLRFTNEPSANQYLHYEYRKGWTL